MGKAETTKQNIVEQVAELFNKKGYYATSLGDLVAATGLSKGSIYGNFANKEEVAVEAFKYNISLMMTLFRNEKARYKNSVDQLCSYVNVYRRENSHMIRGGCPLLNTLVDSDNTNSTLKELSISILEKWKKEIEKIVLQGIERGEIKEGVDPSTTAEIMISLFEGAGLLTRTSGNERYMDSALDHVESILQNIKK